MLMATAKYTRTKTRTKKIPKGNVKCNMCGGKGYHKARKKS